jgi:hypothetical protein
MTLKPIVRRVLDSRPSAVAVSIPENGVMAIKANSHHRGKMRDGVHRWSWQVTEDADDYAACSSAS